MLLVQVALPAREQQMPLWHIPKIHWESLVQAVPCTKPQEKPKQMAGAQQSVLVTQMHSVDSAAQTEEDGGFPAGIQQVPLLQVPEQHWVLLAQAFPVWLQQYAELQAVPTPDSGQQSEGLEQRLLVAPGGMQQRPLEQSWPEPHIFPQAPQLLVLLWVSVHTPLQATWPLGQQTLLLQSWPVPQALVQDPQC